MDERIVDRMKIKQILFSGKFTKEQKQKLLRQYSEKYHNPTLEESLKILASVPDPLDETPESIHQRKLL